MEKMIVQGGMRWKFIENEHTKNHDIKCFIENGERV